MVVAKVAQLTRHTVTYDRAAHGFGYHKTASGGFGPIDAFLYVHHKDATRNTAPVTYRSSEIGAAVYPLLVSEHRATRPRTAGVLRREAAAALTTTRTKDGASGTGAHTQTEAVRLGATTVIGLERPLAHWRALLELRCTPYGMRGAFLGAPNGQ